MKTCFLFLLLLFGKPNTTVVNDSLKLHLHDVSFSILVSEIQSQTGVKVFYDEKLLETVKVTIDSDSISIQEALEHALKGTNIKVSVWNNNFVLLPNETLLTSLPAIEYEDIKDTSNIKHAVDDKSSSDFMSTRNANVAQSYVIGQKKKSSKNANVKIKGKIVDDETGMPLVNATVLLTDLGKGTVSNIDGVFNFVLKPGIYNARIESLGYEKKKISIEVFSDGNFNMDLKKENLLIDEVAVYGDLKTNIRAKDPGFERIASKTIKNIPVMIGERDILKISSLLPGIVNVGEGSSGLNVRGGSSDQNAFYINKIPIYNTSHLFGFFPAFNSDIIKDFSIYKGYIPAQFGGRLSSVFNITTKEPGYKNFTAHGGINPISAYLTVEGPLFNDSLSMLLSGRVSYSDWILSKIKDPTISNSKANFNDFSGSINYRLKKSKIALFVYNSNDKFNLADLNEYGYSNLGSSLNLLKRFSKSVKGEFALVGSQYTFSTIDNQDQSMAYKHSYKLQHYEFSASISHAINDKLSFDYGVGSIFYKLDRGVVNPYGAYSLRDPLDLGKEQSVEGSAFVTGKYNVFSALTLTLGYRHSAYAPIGPQSVYIYSKNAVRDLVNVIDTLNFSKNEPVKWYFSPEIRSTINFQTDRNGSVKLAFNQMQQNLFMLSNTVAVAPNTQWKLADYNIKPAKSYQVSFGVFRNIPREKLEFSVECYYKDTKDAPEFKDGANFLETPATETTILQGKQKSYGIEFFIKRTGKNLEGWISYTYSRSLVTVDGPNDWDKINEGDTYPSNFDIPHNFNALINYHFNRRLTLSTVTTYHTGRPVTYPLSIYYLNGIPFNDYSKRNKYNIPDYFRIDASITFEGNLKKKKFAHSSLMLSVYNLTGRKNAYSVYYKATKAQIYSYKYSVIGVPIITATWIVKLGNYDSE